MKTKVAETFWTVLFKAVLLVWRFWFPGPSAGPKAKTAGKIKKTITAVAVAGGVAIHPAGLNLIKQFEGFEGKAYKDMVGVKTIGYGHTNMAGSHKFKMGDVWTKTFATKVLAQDLVKYRNIIDKQVTVPLTRCQLAVLTSWTYNVGGGATGRSTLVRKLNKGDYASVPSQLMRWNRAGGKPVRGLTRRRAAEAKLWRTNCGEKQ